MIGVFPCCLRNRPIIVSVLAADFSLCSNRDAESIDAGEGVETSRLDQSIIVHTACLTVPPAGAQTPAWQLSQPAQPHPSNSALQDPHAKPSEPTLAAHHKGGVVRSAAATLGAEMNAAHARSVTRVRFIWHLQFGRPLRGVAMLVELAKGGRATRLHGGAGGVMNRSVSQVLAGCQGGR